MLEKLSGPHTTNMFVKTALIYGWYNKGNVGDQLFIESFKQLFPEFTFTFTDIITVELLKAHSTVIFGGGAFLLQAPEIESNALALLEQKNIFYIGVGAESVIHPIHEKLIKLAKLVAIRTPQTLDKVKSLNQNTVAIPDIVFSLQDRIKKSIVKEKSVLILPNITVVPKYSDPQWKHAAWGYFKSEFCQFLDHLVKEGYTLNFLSMCSNNAMDDGWAASELVAHMENRSSEYIIHEPISGFTNVSELFSQYQFVITQRFHGIVLAEMTRVPYIALYHHDKLKNCFPSEGNYLSYYGVTKQDLIEQFNITKGMKYSSLLPIETNIFEKLQQSFKELQSEE